MGDQLDGGLIIVQGTPRRQSQYLRTLQEGVRGLTVRRFDKFFERHDRHGKVYTVKDSSFRQRLLRYLHTQVRSGTYQTLALADASQDVISASEVDIISTKVRCTILPDGTVSPVSMQQLLPPQVRARLVAHGIAGRIAKHGCSKTRDVQRRKRTFETSAPTEETEFK